MKMKISFLAIALFAQGLDARYHVIKNDTQFFNEINAYRFSIVCFLTGFDEAIDKDEQKQMKKENHQLQDMIKSISETDPYKKDLRSDVGFLIVDASKDSMQSIVDKYIVKNNAMPQFLLFKDGKAVMTMSDKLAQLSGFIEKADLMQYMNDYFGKDFDEVLAQKSDDQNKEREMQLARYQAYAASRYPYGGYAPYNIWGSPSFAMYTGYASFYPYGYGYNGYAYLIP